MGFGGAGEDEFLDTFGHLEDLEESDTSFVPFVITFLTSSFVRSIKYEILRIGDILADASEDLFLDALVRCVRNFAVFTEFAGESLVDDELETRDNEERIDSEVDETLEGINRGIGMNGGEYEMSRDRCLDREMGCIGITNLSDHDDIGILTQETPESIREIESDLRIDLTMIGSFDTVLDRIFEGGDIFFFGIEVGEHRVERRGLTGTGWSDDEDESELVLKMLLDLDHIHREDSDGAEIHELALFLENTNNDFFSINRRDDTNTEVYILATHRIAITRLPILWEALLVDLETREDLDTGDERGLFTIPEVRVLDESPIDPHADLETVFSRFDMDIRCPASERCRENRIDIDGLILTRKHIPSRHRRHGSRWGDLCHRIVFFRLANKEIIYL